MVEQEPMGVEIIIVVKGTLLSLAKLCALTPYHINLKTLIITIVTEVAIKARISVVLQEASSLIISS